MLQSIRDGLQSNKWLMYIVLGLLAVIFAAWGAYGLVNFNTTGASYAAEADGVKIPVETARNLWVQEQSQYQQRTGGEIPDAQKPAVQDHLLESLIREALLTARSHELGYRVSQRDVLDAIRNEPAFQIEGKFSPEVARERLAQAGITLDAFQTELRDALQRAQLQNGIVMSEFETPVEAERNRALQDEQREVRFALLPAQKYSADMKVDDADIQAYYKGHLSQYMQPESASLQYAELRLEQLAAQITPTDAELHAAYEKNKDKYNEPEKRRARHILIPVGKDDAAARKRAEDVLAQAKSGKDFAALAKQYSQDPGSADQGGDLGWSERGQFVAPFADALFGMKAGEIAGPVKTQFGYHIIRLDEIQPGKVKPFDEVRPELEAELKKNAATDRFGEIQEQIQARVEQSGGDLAALAREFKLQTGVVARFEHGPGGAPLGVAQPLQDIVFGDNPLPSGRIGGPVLLGEDRLVLAKVTERHKAEPKSLADVRDGIIDAIKKERGTQAALKAAEEGKSRLETGASFDDVVKQLGVSSQPAAYIGRADTAVPEQIRTLAFNVPKPADKGVYRAIALNTGGAALLAVTKVRTQVPTADKDQRDQQLKRQEQQERQDEVRAGQVDAAAYVEELRRTSKVAKNPRAFE